MNPIITYCIAISILDKLIKFYSYYILKNWNMSEQLSYMMPGKPNQLSDEKKAIAELEDTVAERIFYLKQMSTATGESNNSHAFSPMEEYCTNLLSKVNVHQSDEVLDHTASQMNAAQALALLGSNGNQAADV